MKKLITLLSTAIIAMSGAMAVVSCKKEEARTNSQFIKGDGSLDIDAKDLLKWYKEWNGVNHDEGFINSFYNTLAVGILKGIADKKEFELPTGEKAKKRGWDDSLNTELENLLGKQDGSTPNSLYSFAHSALRDKKENEFKDNHKGYIKFLEDKFKNVKRGDERSLENAFLSDYILSDPSNSAFIRLKNTLMFNSTISNSLWRKGIQTNDLDVSAIVKKFAEVDAYKNKNTLDDLAKAIKEVFSKDSVDWNTSAVSSFTDLVNSVGGVNFGNNNNNNISITYSSPEEVQKKIKDGNGKEEWIKTILKRFVSVSKDDNSNKGINEFINWVEVDNYNGPNNFVNYEGLTPRSWSKIVKQIPVLNGKDLKRDDIKGNFGSITDSQKFSIDNYFNREKPVMVSDLIFNFANSKKKEDVEKQLSLEALIPTSSTSNDLTKELVNRFQGIAATLKAYVKDDQKDGKEVPHTAGLSRFDTIFRGADRVLKANVSGSANNFSEWTQWDKENTYHKVNKTGDLLTISDTSFSNVAKYSVYDFLTNKDNHSSNCFEWKDDIMLEKENLTKWGISDSQAASIMSALEKHVETKKAIANIINLFEKVNQKANNNLNYTTNNDKNMNQNMFTVLNKDNGIIAYIDGDGLHITKVDGYKLIMNQKPNEYKQSEIDINKQTAILKKIDSLYTSSGKDLVPYLINSMLKDSVAHKTLTTERAKTTSSETKVEEKVWAWTPKDLRNSKAVSNMGVEIQHLNNNFKNNYERFLVNTSLIDNTKTKTFYNTNILNEVSKATDMSSSNLSSQASWLLGLFSKVFANDEIINKIIKLPEQEVTEKKANEAGKRDIKVEFDHLVTSVILDRQKIEKTSAISQFLSDNQKWLISIRENWKTQSKEVTNIQKFIPDQAIDLTSDDKKRFNALLNSKIFDPYVEIKTGSEEK